MRVSGIDRVGLDGFSLYSFDFIIVGSFQWIDPFQIPTYARYPRAIPTRDSSTRSDHNLTDFILFFPLLPPVSSFFPTFHSLFRLVGSKRKTLTCSVGPNSNSSA